MSLICRGVPPWALPCIRSTPAFKEGAPTEGRRYRPGTTPRYFILTRLASLLFILFWSVWACGQTPTEKVYRGAIGDKHIEMRLTVSGAQVTGTYFYDQFKQEIILTGAYDAKRQLELVETVKKRKTGRFVCKAEPEDSNTDLDCEWTRPDATGTRIVFLIEQGIRFTKGTKIVPKTVLDPKTKASASYPQLTAPAMTDAIKAFNALVEARVKASMKEFEAEPNSVFDANYNVLFADDDTISIEMSEYFYAGGAHPNTRLWTVNYSLKGNKELSLKDVFKDDEGYKTAIAEFVAKDINRRAEQMDIADARRNNRPVEKRTDAVMTVDRLPEMDTWGLSTKGLVAYFDFPHVMAVFDKTIVPYNELSQYLRPDGVTASIR